MNITITVGQIKKLYNGLVGYEAKKLPVYMSFAIIGNMYTLKREMDKYESARIQRCRQLARKDEQGNPIQKDGNYDIPEEEIDDFLKELADLAAMDITLDLQTIRRSELRILDAGISCRYDLLSVKELMDLDFMLEKDEVE